MKSILVFAETYQHLLEWACNRQQDPRGLVYARGVESVYGFRGTAVFVGNWDRYWKPEDARTARLYVDTTEDISVVQTRQAE